jgi:ribosome-associated toxin RatA of RatAB toxin-antitoxin module
MSVNVPVSIGELIDKYTILLIKREKIVDDDTKLMHVNNEIGLLQPIIADLTINEYDIDELKQCNTILWKIEDDIRDKERTKLFDEEFIQLARSVYITNDKRCQIKNNINFKYKSNIFEVKSYKEY